MLLVLGCAEGSLVQRGEVFRHRVHGYTIGQPPEVEPPWRRLAVRGSVLAYTRGDSAVMSLRSSCRRPLAEPEYLARHLLIGLPEHVLRQQGPLEVAGLVGWGQTFDTLDAERSGAVVRVKTVTLVAGRCSVDWILSARQGFEAAEPAFDAWLQSFRYEGGPAAVAAP